VSINFNTLCLFFNVLCLAVDMNCAVFSLLRIVKGFNHKTTHMVMYAYISNHSCGVVLRVLK